MIRIIVSFLLLSSLCACPESDPQEPEVPEGDFTEIERSGPIQVDLLFVVDNSNSTLEMQNVMAQQAEILLEELISPDDGGDETPPPVTDLHLGVVSIDMGVGGFPHMTCDEPHGGDAGALQNRGRWEGCEPTYNAPDCDGSDCPWLTHSIEHPNDDSTSEPPIWEEFGCIASLGIGGCGFEQPLESSLAALTTQTEPGGANEGFLRDRSLLVVIYIMDEDDCSAEDTDLFNPDRDELGPMNVRCAINDDMLFPVSRYYNGLRGLRPGMEESVVVAVIAGIPIDGSWNVGDSLEDLREQQHTNPSNPNELVPSCMTPIGIFMHPPRLAELAYLFENNGILATSCSQDWTSTYQAIARKIQSKVEPICLNLPDDPERYCRVVEALDGDRPCPHPTLPEGSRVYRTEGWHIDLGLDDDGRRLCEILPTNDDESLQGWTYGLDDPYCDGGTIQVTGDEVVDQWRNILLECL